MLKPVFLVAFSGHRPDDTPGRTDAALENTAPHLRKALESLQARVKAVDGELHFITGVAAGADIVAGEVARSLGIPLHFVLPKPEEEFLLAFSGKTAGWKPRALDLLDTARPSEKQAASHPQHTFRVGGVSRKSPDCYAEANAHMLEAADLLLTVSSGAPSKSIAGTTHLIAQAEALRLPQVNIDPTARYYGEAYSERHIAGFAAPDSPSLQVFDDLRHHVVCDLEGASSSFSALASCLSKAAAKSSSGFRRGTAFAISFHALAGFIAAAAAALYFALKTDASRQTAYWILAILALLELVLVATAFLLEMRSQRYKDQHTWLNCRFGRELMRGIKAANPFLDPLFPEIRRHHPHWGRFAIACALSIRAETGPLDDSSPDAIKAARDSYLGKRIRNQIGHFREKSAEARFPSVFFNSLAHYAGPVALAVVFIAFLAKADDLAFHGHHKPGILVNPWGAAVLLLFLPIFVPLLASLSSSFLAAFDFGRRAVRYQEMLMSLQAVERWLPTVDALSIIQTSVRHAEEILLDEQIEWLAAQKSGFGH